MSPFHQLPAELIGAICKAITEDDVDDRESLATLANLARVCKALSEFAQRTLYEHEKHVGQPLRYCYGLRTGNLDAVKTAIRLGWKINERIVLCSKVFDPKPSQRLLEVFPLHIAAAAGHLRIVRHLVESGAYMRGDGVDTGRTLSSRYHGWEPPYYAMKTKNDQRRNAENTKDIFIRPSESWPAMHFGAVGTTPQSFHWSSSYTPLRLAIINGHEEVATYLIEGGNFASTEDLHCAIQSGLCKLMQFLIDRGVPATKETLFRAAKMPHAAQVAAILLRAGADPNGLWRWVDNERHNDNMLMELGIDRTVCHVCTEPVPERRCGPDSQNLTILGYACYLGAYDMAHLLLDYGADASIGQAWIWQHCLHGFARTRETARLLDRMIKAGLDVNHLETRCEVWRNTHRTSVRKALMETVPDFFNNEEMMWDEYLDEMMYEIEYDSSDDGWFEYENNGEEAHSSYDGWLEYENNGEEADSSDDGWFESVNNGETGPSHREDSDTDGFGLPLFRHCMDDYGDGFRGFLRTRQLDIARTLLKHGASMAVPDLAIMRPAWNAFGPRRGEMTHVFAEHKGQKPTHHAPRCSLYDSLETGSVLWFWALCRLHFDLCDLLREYGAPVPQTNDELKLTVLMVFNGRRLPNDKSPRYPHIDRSEFPTRATFGDTARGRFMSPHYREKILDYLTSTIVPADSWLRNQQARDSWLEEYEFGFLTTKALEGKEPVVTKICQDCGLKTETGHK